MSNISLDKLPSLLGVSTVMIFEHIQLASYMRHAFSPNGDSWDNSAVSAFDGLKKIALRFTGDSFLSVYFLSCIFTITTFLLYVIFTRQINHANKSKTSKLRYVIWLFEYVIFGLGFVPMIGALSEVQYCNKNEMESYTSVECWTNKQMAYMYSGFIFAGFAILVAAIFLPALKSERGGVEKRWGDETFFFAYDRIMVVGTIYLLAPIRLPYVGIIACAVLALYVLIFECYHELHIASLKLGLILGLLWLFVCTETADDNGSKASDMLIAWPIIIIVGYFLLWIKSLFIERKYKHSALQK